MSNTPYTILNLPTSPDEIGVQLSSAELKNIDFSALDFATARRAIIEYIQAYFPDDFNDFVASNGAMMMSEIVASNTAKLSLRGDMLANEAFLPTAKTEEAVENHLNLINQRIRRQTPSSVNVEVSVSRKLTTDIEITPGLRFSVRGPDNSPVYYELYRAPGDYTSNIIIPASKRGVIAYGIEGRFVSPTITTSAGGPNQQLVIRQPNILDAPITATIDTGDGGEVWTVTENPLEFYGPTDKVINLKLYSDMAIFTFGDNNTGAAPTAGQQILIKYRVGGGIRGKIGALAINETRSISPAPPATSPVQVLFRNLEPSIGGRDRESISSAKKRAPRDFVVRAFASDRPASIVTAQDYVQVAMSFSHPVYGSVAKAMVTLRSDINTNLVEVYVLVDGSNGLETPSVGLKQALKTYLNEYNVLTDSVNVLDGTIHTVDVKATVVVGRNSDATFVKSGVQAALDNFFSTDNRDMGQALYVSELFDTISSIDGIVYTDLLEPVNNLLSSGELAIAGDNLIGVNEIVVEGNRDIRFYYEKTRPR